VEAAHELASQPDKGAIDHQGQQSQRQDCKRQQDVAQERPEHGIHQADDSRGHKSDGKTIHAQTT
jgi:hypothetical protein